MIALAAAGPAAAAPPSVSPVRGFTQACLPCHGPSGYGTQRIALREGQERAQLLARNDLTAELVRQVVRQGFLAMPPLSRVEVSDRELDRIIAGISKR